MKAKKIKKIKWGEITGAEKRAEFRRYSEKEGRGGGRRIGSEVSLIYLMKDHGFVCKINERFRQAEGERPQASTEAPN